MVNTVDLHAHSLHQDDHQWSQATVPESDFNCEACGLRLLELLLGSQKWVHRRVERVTFCDDRAVTRRISIGLTTPEGAPLIRAGNEKLRLLPLTVMRRKTLVNFSLSEAQGTPLTLLGLRHNQALTLGMLTGLAKLTLKQEELEAETQYVLTRLAVGSQEELRAALSCWKNAPKGSELGALRAAAQYSAIQARLTDNFLMLALLPTDEHARTSIRFSYDEPLSLRYRESDWLNYEAPPDAAGPRERRTAPESWSAAIGWRPVRVRFPVPAAENARSFHFEIEAPSDVVIISASIVAGRPDSGEPPSWDEVVGGFPVVGLHVIEVDSGSQSQVQVDLGVSQFGWLPANALASVINTLVLLGAFWLAWEQKTTFSDLPEGTVGLMIAVTAAATGWTTRPDKHPMAGRLLRRLRQLATVSAVLPLIAAAALTVGKEPAWIIGPLLPVSLSLTIILCVAWWRACTAHGSARDVPSLSPWEQGAHVPEPTPQRRHAKRDWRTAVSEFGFDEPAVRVASAEAPHIAGDSLIINDEQALASAIHDRLSSPAG